ncbi:MAG: cyclic AMP receptor protein,catabolite gene activator [uncultured bacterium (gcode 4)]|uniref:Cyclic AMP receptor protein,catabolite gene activator n=1 Tax=uncultured bacterium (gcode 4) TaxID=1234023 RepID=K2FW81_9BACT|nr:MAG: cyclic AMP receptor protein,catabolite gene activator [uncultured bacterium (gcode 4)]
MSILSWISLFDTLSSTELENLALFCQERFIKSWEILFKEWDEAGAMYVVKLWKLKAYKERSDGEMLLWYIQNWEFVGEMSFFDGQDVPKKRMATVKALDDTQLIVIMNYSIVDLAAKRKDIYDKIVDIIKERKYKNALK